MSANSLRPGHDSTTYRSAVTNNAARTSFARRGDEHPAIEARTHRAAVRELLIVISSVEAHREVAIRAQLLARDTRMARTLSVIRYCPEWQRWADTISSLVSAAREITAEVSARVLRASVPGHRACVEVCVSAADVARKVRESDLVLVGRRRTFPWLLAPLARYARLLLRRSRTPLLIVGRFPTGAYRNVVIATDLQTDLDRALELTGHVAPGATLTLLHVYRGFLESSLRSAGAPDAPIVEQRRTSQRTAALGLRRLLQRHGSVDRAVLAHGSPVQDVLRKARELEADLIVVVRTTHSRWAEVFGASVSLEIATWADRDVLVVHRGNAPCK